VPQTLFPKARCGKAPEEKAQSRDHGDKTQYLPHLLPGAQNTGHWTSSFSITWQLFRIAVPQTSRIRPGYSKIPLVVLMHIKAWEAVNSAAVSVVGSTRRLTGTKTTMLLFIFIFHYASWKSISVPVL